MQIVIAIWILNSNFDEENDEDDNSSGIDDEGLAGGLGPLLGGGFPDKERNVPKWTEPAIHQGSLPPQAEQRQDNTTG